jgi:hypothetical protein
LAIQIGPQLTNALIRKIRLESKRESNEVVFLISVDDDAYPNAALLSFSELVVKSPKLILFAVGETSSSRKNLMRTSRGSLVFWGGKNSGMYYIKGKVRLLKSSMEANVEGFKCSALILDVEKVSRDYSPIARLLSPMTYETKRVGKEHGELQRELQSLSKSL